MLQADVLIQRAITTVAFATLLDGTGVPSFYALSCASTSLHNLPLADLLSSLLLLCRLLCPQDTPVVCHPLKLRLNVFNLVEE